MSWQPRIFLVDAKYWNVFSSSCCWTNQIYLRSEAWQLSIVLNLDNSSNWFNMLSEARGSLGSRCERWIKLFDDRNYFHWLLELKLMMGARPNILTSRGDMVGQYSTHTQITFRFLVCFDLETKWQVTLSTIQNSKNESTNIMVGLCVNITTFSEP